MEINLTDVTAIRAAAIFQGACAPWAGSAVEGANHAQRQLMAAAPAMAQTRQLVGMADEWPVVNGNRKQTVHKTRISAGGFGAMGPQPDREPA